MVSASAAPVVPVLDRIMVSYDWRVYNNAYGFKKINKQQNIFFSTLTWLNP